MSKTERRLLPPNTIEGVYDYPDGSSIRYCPTVKKWAGRFRTGTPLRDCDDDGITENTSYFSSAEEVAKILLDADQGPASLIESKERFPQRFRYKVDGNDRWLYGCYVPAEKDDDNRCDWIVVYANGTCYRPRFTPGIHSGGSGFDEAEWIDNDMNWPGDRMPEETCVWEWSEDDETYKTTCERDVGFGDPNKRFNGWQNVHKFCQSCGRAIEVKE